MKKKLIIFLRAPQAGHPKTRLAKKLGGHAATAVYKTLVDRLLTALRSIEQVELRFTPDSAGAEITPWLQAGWRLTPQGEGDLGKRLSRAVEQTFATASHRVAIIGSDCPSITVADVESAWHSLLSHDVVLGPARDGGYWLIGFNAPHTELFRRIPWSTPSVLEATLSRIRAAGLKFECLQTLADIDTVEDWDEYNRS